MARLMHKLAQSAATKEQYIAWLDEMEADLKAADASALRSMIDDCRSLVGEQTEALDQILSSER